MESKYDRVAYPENVYLHSDGELDDFGTGVYPVQRRPYKNDNIKVACIKVKRSPRLFVIVGVVVLVLVAVLITIIATSSISKEQEQEQHQQEKIFGLLVYPRVENNLIKFNPNVQSSYLKYSDSLDDVMHHYNTIDMTNKKGYVDCTSSSGPPDGQECRLDAAVFGNECTHFKDYGFKEQGRPCVLLQLNLPNGTIPVPFSEKSSPVLQLLGKRWSPNHVGVTCDGEDEESRKHLVPKMENPFHDAKGRNESMIDILPPQGFPISFFVKKTRSDIYVPPAVMVHFNNLLNNVFIKIKCVAWAQNFNSGHPESSELYTAKFQFFVE